MKRLNQILNIVIGATLGVFAGDALFLYWDWRTHPELYAMNSAPWYTGLMVYGFVAAAAILISLIVKAIIRPKLK